MTRVFCVVFNGEAPPDRTGKCRSLATAPDAFGRAATLNSEFGWSLNMGHDGPVLTYGGEKRGLVAHNTEAGLVFEWRPRMDDPAHRDAVAKIEKGWGCSAQYSYIPRNLTQLPSAGVDVLRRGRLIHVAVVDRSACPGSIAMVFRGSRRGDRDQLREQLAKVVRQSHFAYRRSRGWV